MIVFEYQGRTMECRPEDSWFFSYDNDLLDGFYHDVDEQQYVFVSAHSTGYEPFADVIRNHGGFESVKFDVGDYSVEEPPHCYIYSSLKKTILAECVQLVTEGEK